MTPEENKAKAITFAIVQSVENWLSGNMERANHFFEIALTFKDAPANLFNPEEIQTHV